jgi:hypothetical protein
MSRLKRENTHLKQQLTFQSNDILSESQIRLKPNGLNTINQHDTINSDISEDLPHVTSQGNTAKLNHKVHHKKEDTKSLAARTEDSLSQNRSTFQRGTGVSMFPSVHKGSGKGANKILERIMEIERTKQENKLRLEK